MGLIFVVALVLFGFGAVVWTFVYPVLRPRTIVSRWGIQSLFWRPGGTHTLFETSWSDVETLGGLFTATRWPFPPTLRVTITARGNSVLRNVLFRPGLRLKTLDITVNPMLRGRPRDVLAFLLHVREDH